MFERILFPTDFSESSKKAVMYITELKKAGAEEVIILHVIDDTGLEDMVKHCKKAGFDTEDFKNNILGEITQEKRRDAEALKQSFDSVGFKTTVQVGFGRPHKEICRIAEKKDVSLIVIGAQGKDRISSIILGSVSEGTLRNSRVPVLVVR